MKLGDVVSIEKTREKLPLECNWLLNLDAIESNTGNVITKMRVPSSELGGSIIPFRSGTVLYSKLRPNLNKVVLADEDGYATSELLPMIADECRLRKEYLAAFLRSKPFVKGACECVAGAKMPRISRRDVLAARIPLPSLRVQQELCDLLTLLHELLMVSNQWTVKLDALVKSRFVEMFDGKGYPTSSVSTLVSSMRNGLSPSKSGSYRSKVLTLSAITQGRFDPLAWKEGFFSEEPPANKRVSDEDFYICRGNGNIHLVGTGEYSSVSMEDAVFPDTMIALKLKRERIILPFLRCAWNQISTRKQIEASAKTTNGTFKINQAALGNIELPVPPLELQLEFADFVAEVDKSRFVVQQQIEKLQMLYDSLAQEYFS